jgi:hypothetical protein
MKKFILQKLDARHHGSAWFTHRVEVLGDMETKAQMLHNVRIWCWETFGSSCELDYLNDCYKEPVDPTAKKYPWDLGITVDWAWRVDDRRMFVYLRNSALTNFQLKWM